MNTQEPLDNMALQDDLRGDLQLLERHLLSAPRRLNWIFFQAPTLAQALSQFWPLGQNLFKPEQMQQLRAELESDWPGLCSPSAPDAEAPTLSRQRWQKLRIRAFSLCLSFWTCRALPSSSEKMWSFTQSALPTLAPHLDWSLVFWEAERREEWLRFCCRNLGYAILNESPQTSERRWQSISSQRRAELYRRLRQRQRRRAQNQRPKPRQQQELN